MENRHHPRPHRAVPDPAPVASCLGAGEVRPGTLRRLAWTLASVAAGCAAHGQTQFGEYVQQTIPLRPIAGSELPYTIKKGDFRLLLSPSFTTEWNDNVNGSGGVTQDDFILRPMLNIDASYPITANNLLRLNVGFGYDQYLDNTDLSTWRLNTGTALSFDIVVKDFLINLHDRVSYQRNSARRGDIAGNAEQGNLENTAGILVSRNFGRATASLGFDHQNAFAISEELEYQNRATEIVSLRGGVQLRPDLVVGLESPLTFTAYDLPVLNDNTGYGGGVYAEWLLGSTLTVMPRFGYSVYDFSQTSDFILAEDQNSWYADLTIRHQPREAISYSISVGHELRLGLQADALTAWYVRPNINWQMTQRISVQPLFFYEHGEQSAVVGFRGQDEVYDWYGFGVSANTAITSKLRATLSYRLTLRSSTLANRDFDQNIVSLGLTYAFQ